ncbi:low molecular weight phosphotyrosine protein phosphatase [Sporothrix brasiliensis 5110]|uniref:Low molecular weight phosphotyrosine protein phosphatase n=1 Tax=Sporothrix brasiliensis 5110 TaxID=1398154 RepID=A0A0C2IQ03_9PEZI|nr:low molecular weight phosphotyrosine protein phosphatase [Sporothrix brasiliensis 5110]KIH91111.1 low molecular weight phosphotyrosine protein phosphatase [Sporothrix brasiliensis 5110]
MPDQIAVLFCCMGNICRSTMAEGVFQAMAKKEPYNACVSKVDSCGTISYHTGDDPDDRTMATLAAHGITDYAHRARMLQAADLDRFDYIFAMDKQNLSDIQRLQQKHPNKTRAQVMLFGAYATPDGDGREVISDPYYGGHDGFSKAYEQATRFSKNFLKAAFPEITPP